MKSLIRLGVACTLVIACAKKPTPASPENMSPSAAAKPASVACPADEQLTTLLAKAWKIDTDGIESIVACAPGHFPDPGLAVFAHLNDPDDDQNTFTRLAVVDADGNTLAELSSEPDLQRFESIDEITKLAADDLDGDGRDELVATRSSSYNLSPTTEAVVVYQVKDRRLEQLLARGYAFTTADDSDGNEGQELCEGGYEITARALRITGKQLGPLPAPAKGEAAAECVQGSETYVMKDGKLIAQ